MLNFIHEYIPEQSGSPWTLLLLHGTGADERNLLSLGAEMAPGTALLSPRGKSAEDGMNRFFRRPVMGAFEIEDMKFRTHELADFVEAAATHYAFDPGKVIAVGYSNGATAAAGILLLRSHVLAGAVLLRPMVPLVPDPLPPLEARPIWIAGGKRDTLVLPAQTAALSQLLKSAGAAVTEHWSPGGHELNLEELQAAATFLSAMQR